MILPRSMPALVLAVAIALFAGCLATSGATVCRPRSAVHCLTPVECTVDRRAGCEVCRCADPSFVPIGASGDRPR